MEIDSHTRMPLEPDTQSISQRIHSPFSHNQTYDQIDFATIRIHKLVKNTPGSFVPIGVRSMLGGKVSVIVRYT